MVSNIFKMKIETVRRNVTTAFVPLLRVQMFLELLPYTLLGKSSTGMLALTTVILRSAALYT